MCVTLDFFYFIFFMDIVFFGPNLPAVIILMDKKKMIEWNEMNGEKKSKKIKYNLPFFQFA